MRKTLLTLGGLMVAAVMLAPTAAAAHSATITNKGEATPGTYTIKLDVDKFTLKSAFADAGEGKKGEGHIHYLVNGEDACKAGKADCSAPTDYATASKSFTFKNLEEGDKIEVELVLADHSPSGTDSSGDLNGQRVTDSVTVSESKGAPGFGIVAVLAAVGAVLAVMRRR